MEALHEFIGEYDELRFDDGCKYEYIDLDDRRDIVVDVGRHMGNPKAEKTETVAPVQPAADDIELKLKEMLIEYVLQDNQEAAKAIARVIKLMTEDKV